MTRKIYNKFHIDADVFASMKNMEKEHSKTHNTRLTPTDAIRDMMKETDNWNPKVSRKEGEIE